MTADDYRQLAYEARRNGDRLKPDTAMNRYSIAACEVWALALDRIAEGGAEPWELFLAFRRQKQLTAIYGVDP